MNRIELINASAGSGKTYSLTNRVVEEIEGGTPPEALMAMTFTNKAAAELSERIRVRLLKSGHEKEAYRLSDGFIGTVNGICARLLMEYAIEAGMSPAIETMPEEDSAKIFNIAIDNVIEKHASKIEPAARRLELDGRGSGYAARKDWREHVKQAVDLARSNRIAPEQMKGFSQRSWQAFERVLGEAGDLDFDEALKAVAGRAVEDLKKLGGLTKTTQKVLETLETCLESMDRGTMTWADWCRLSKLKPAKDGQSAIGPVTAFASRVLNHPGLHSDLKGMIEGVFGCAAEALSEYETYKKEHGVMDFTDQETHVLDMLQTNDSFKASLRNRIGVLMVDEFQDTSPIQLALFLEFDKLAGKSVWVGDPKQAIYGFRGTDPQLMDEVVASIGESQVLGCSWRSKENLLDFTNALFAEAFHEMDPEMIRLAVPPERKEKAEGGRIEEWHLAAKNKQEDADAIAVGVKDLLGRASETQPGDVAVLCRTNDECREIAASLKQLGLRVSVGQGSLMDMAECRLAMGALRYMNNKEDALALAEIVKTTQKEEPGGGWLTELMTDPEAAKDKWCGSQLVEALNEGRKNIGNWTPLEALEQAISRVGLLERVKAWSDPELARSNLDALRGVCAEYIDICASRRSAVTIDGFVAYLNGDEREQAKGMGEETVNVLTYHGAKGLEWPWVVLAGLDKSASANVFGVNIEAAGAFDPTRPLTDRVIRYWPWPFGKQKTHPLLDEELETHPVKKQAVEKMESEERRLLYVGMTRARDGLVLAMRNEKKGLKTAQLDAMKDREGRKIVSWDGRTGEKEITVGKETLTVSAFDYAPQPGEGSQTPDRKAEFLPDMPETETEYPPARVSPSTLQGTLEQTGTWEEVCTLGPRIGIAGEPEMDKLGNAIHSYLAVAHKLPSVEKKKEIAKDILKKWGMEEHLDSCEVVDAEERLAEFLAKGYPGSKVFREWPISMRNAQGQKLSGWLDLLVETETGYVVIDHKDYPGPDAAERAKRYEPQLRAYKEAVEKATGKPVVDMLLHFPISGRMLRFCGKLK